jgi:hypothetical protein
VEVTAQTQQNMTDFDASTRIMEKVRRESLAAFNRRSPMSNANPNAEPAEPVAKKARKPRSSPRFMALEECPAPENEVPEWRYRLLTKGVSVRACKAKIEADKVELHGGRVIFVCVHEESPAPEILTKREVKW